MKSNKNIYRNVKNTYTTLKFICVIFTFLFIVFFLFFCKVDVTKVNVFGNININKSDIVSTSGIEDGIHMYSINKNEIENNIVTAFSTVSSVKIKRSFPSTLNIYIYEEIPSFVFFDGKKYIILNRELRLITYTDFPQEYFSLGAIPIYLPEILESKIGEKLTFPDDNTYTLYADILKTIYDSDIGVNITSLDLSSKYNVTFLYNDMYTVVLGTYIDIDTKINTVAKTVKKLSVLYPGIYGTIFATTVGEASFVKK